MLFQEDKNNSTSSIKGYTQLLEETIKKSKELEILESIVKLIQETPNDGDLGRKIRTIYTITDQFKIVP